MKKTFLRIATIACLVATPAIAETTITFSSDAGPQVGVRANEAQEVGGLVAPSKANEPDSEPWFIPRFLVEGEEGGSSTFFSVRNQTDDISAAILSIEYFDVNFNQIAGRTETLAVRELRPFDASNIPELVVEGGVTEGFIRITPDEPIVVDAFQIDSNEDFAQGSVAVQLTDFCELWGARFLSFGGDNGSVITLFVNGPPDDNIVAVIDFYDEAGDYITTAIVSSDDYVSTLESADFEFLQDFGVAEIQIFSNFLPAGYVSVTHQAFGRFSIGAPAYCLETEIMTPARN